MEQFDLRPITHEGLPAAIARAKHYRLLSEPEAAESICLDVLELDPSNQEALVVRILAITDQFRRRGAKHVREAQGALNDLKDDYERSYYAGIISERSARAFLEKGPARVFAYDGLREAMEHFDQAAAIRPRGNDDAVLRYNSCARTIQQEKLEPRPEEAELGLE